MNTLGLFCVLCFLFFFIFLLACVEIEHKCLPFSSVIGISFFLMRGRYWPYGDLRPRSPSWYGPVVVRTAGYRVKECIGIYKFFFSLSTGRLCETYIGVRVSAFLTVSADYLHSFWLEFQIITHQTGISFLCYSLVLDISVGKMLFFLFLFSRVIYWCKFYIFAMVV